MHWIIQSSNIRYTAGTISRMLLGLEAAGSKWTDFGIVDEHQITNWENFPLDEPLFPHCSTGMLRAFMDDSIDPGEIFFGAPTKLAEKLLKQVRAGLFYDELAFDQSIYMMSEGIHPHLLNGNAEISTLAQQLDIKVENDCFIKPGKDLKVFSGGVVKAGTSLRDHIKTTNRACDFEKFGGDTILISEPQNVSSEWRLFVVDKTVVTGSQYRSNQRASYSTVIPDGMIAAMAKAFIEKYSPARAYTMDICLVTKQVGKNIEQETRVVEYNCINCSGIYHSDIAALAKALHV